MISVPSYVNALLYDARCFRCLPDKTQLEIQTYIMAYSYSEFGVDPIVLAGLSKCVACLSRRNLLELKAFLLTYNNGTYWWPNGMIANARCYDCIPVGGQLDVQTYLFAQNPSGPAITEPNELIQAANAFQVLDVETLYQIQVFLLATMLEIPTDAKTLMEYAICMSCVPDPLLAAIATQALDYMMPIPDGSTRTDDERPPIDPPNGPPPPPPPPPPGPVKPPGGGLGCVDDLVQLIPELVAYYTGSLLIQLDILFPKTCCTGPTYYLYGSANSDMSGAVLVQSGHVPRRQSAWVKSIDTTGPEFTFAYYAAKQGCSAPKVISVYSNIIQGVQDPEDSLKDSTLVSYWKLNEASNTTRVDTMGVNDLLDEVPNVPAEVAKISNGSRGAGATVARKLKTAGASPTLDGYGGKSFTICFWFKRYAWVNSSCSLGKWGSQYLWWDTATTGQVEWAAQDAGGVSRRCTYPNGTITIGTWYFISVGYDNTTNEVWSYINVGNFKSTACVGIRAVAGYFSVNNYAQVGAAAGSNSCIDEVGFWDRRLTVAELTYLYNAGVGRTYPFAP